MIKFLCPNGHQLNSPENLIGKAGKCPKCGTAFLVPSPDDYTEEDTAPAPGGSSAEERPRGGSDVLGMGRSGSQVAIGSTTGSSVSSGIASGSGSQSKAEVFVFLCPNGHRLNGPPSLRGKLGKCPHCDARFRIPTEEDEIEQNEEPAQQQYDDDAPLPMDDMEFTLPPDDEFEASHGGGSVTEEVRSAIHNSHLSAVLKSRWKFAHELGEVLTRLWEAKGHTGDVELELAGNEAPMKPDVFSPALSQGNFAVFGISEGTRTHVVVIPWASIVRCRITQIETLPAGLFLE